MGDWISFEKSLASGEAPPCTVLVGAEPFLRQRLSHALQRAALGPDGDNGFNRDVFPGKGLRADTVLAAVRTLPMLSSRRFVWLRDGAAMPSGELDKLEPLLRDPEPSCCLLVVAEKLDGRSRFAKAAKKAGVVVEVKELRGAGLGRFVQQQAKQRGKRLSDEACAWLLEAVGGDLSTLDDAVERLSLFAAEDTISVSDVDQCVARVRGESIWTLVDAVASRRRRDALLATSTLLRDREPPLRILALIARQMRMVARMKGALDEGAAPPAAAKAAGVPPFKARELSAAARKFSFEDLRHAFRVVAEADLELKGAKRDGAVVLEDAILRLSSRSPRPLYDQIIEGRRKMFRAGA